MKFKLNRFCFLIIGILSTGICFATPATPPPPTPPPPPGSPIDGSIAVLFVFAIILGLYKLNKKRQFEN